MRPSFLAFYSIGQGSLDAKWFDCSMSVTSRLARDLKPLTTREDYRSHDCAPASAPLSADMRSSFSSYTCEA